MYPLFPDNIRTFVDLFAGGFNVGINAEAETIICNDQLTYVIDIYKYLHGTDLDVVLADINKIIAEFKLTKENTDGYNALRSRYNANRDILDLLVLTFYAFNNQIRFNNNHEFNSSFGISKSSFNKSIEHNLIGFCKAMHSKNIEFVNKDFTVLDLSKLSNQDFVYCDPPYLIAVGPYNDGNRGFKNWTGREERQLLSLLDKLNEQHVRFALSNVLYHKGHANELLIEWSRKYKVHYLDKSYANCNYQVKDRTAETVEVLITNYEKEQPVRRTVRRIINI